MTLSMSRAERDAFLAETHVAILSVAESGRGPLAVPVWYEYEPGRDIRIVTGGKSRKMSLLRAAGRATLCAQDEKPPYRYVTVEGPIAFGTLDVERDWRGPAIHYLGAQMGEVYLAGMAAALADAVLFTLRPERWQTADFRKWRP